MPNRFITAGVIKKMCKRRCEGSRSMSSMGTCWGRGRGVPDWGSPQDNTRYSWETWRSQQGFGRGSKVAHVRKGGWREQRSRFYKIRLK